MGHEQGVARHGHRTVVDLGDAASGQFLTHPIPDRLLGGQIADVDLRFSVPLREGHHAEDFRSGRHSGLGGCRGGLTRLGLFERALDVGPKKVAGDDAVEQVSLRGLQGQGRDQIGAFHVG